MRHTWLALRARRIRRILAALDSVSTCWSWSINTHTKKKLPWPTSSHLERPALSRTYMRSYNLLPPAAQTTSSPHFSSGIRPAQGYSRESETRARVKNHPTRERRDEGERKKLSPSRLAFLAWDDFHARSTIPEEKWGLLVVCLQRELPCISFNGQSTTSTYMSSTNLKLSDTTAVKWQASCSLEPCTWRTVCNRTTFTLFFYKISSKI